MDCLNCKKSIESPKKFKGKIVQKFCSTRCRMAWHNQAKRRDQAIKFVEELTALLKKYRFVE